MIPYTGEALTTFDRIHILRSYHHNKLYLSPDNVMYYINRHGFLHAYTAGKCKNYDGSKIYFIRDNLLTRDNLLQESLTTFYQTREEAKAAWEAMQADAEANTAEERPQEPARATGTTAGGETITTPKTEPQSATERPQADAEPHHPATDQEQQEAAQDCQTENKPTQDAHKTTGRPQQTATDKEEPSPQESATAGTHSPATYEAQETATATQPATVSEAQEPATDQEPKTAAPCHHPHSTATSPTEARNARRRANYHHRRKNATQSHAGSPQEIRSAADCHRRNLPQGAQQAPQRTEPVQAIHAPPCHRKSHHRPRRDARRAGIERPQTCGRQNHIFKR